MTERTVTELLREQHELIKGLFDQVGATTGDHRREAFDCLRAFLAVHETAEEEVVHPSARTLGAGDAVAARLREEGAAKRMLADLEKVGPDGEGFDDLFAELQAAVIEHAEAEELEVFPILDACQDEEMLRRMGVALLAAERIAPTHPHPHGPESAIGNLLVGPFVAMVDRARDAIRKAAA